MRVVEVSSADGIDGDDGDQEFLSIFNEGVYLGGSSTTSSADTQLDRIALFRMLTSGQADNPSVLTASDANVSDLRASSDTLRDHSDEFGEDGRRLWGSVLMVLIILKVGLSIHLSIVRVRLMHANRHNSRNLKILLGT